MNNPILPQAIKVCQFDNFNVSFTDTAYLNATEIAKSFGKQVRDYLINNRTTDYINAITEYFAETGNPVTAKNQLVIIKKGGNDKNAQGTWLHPKLAIDFARWLNPRFAVWCDMQIAKILNLDENARPQPATKSDRKPLVQAVNMLVSETGAIYSNVWKMIHQRFDVECVDELTCEQVNQAIAYVHGLILEHGNKSSTLSPELTKLLAISIKGNIEHARVLQRINMYGDDAIYTKIDQIRRHTQQLVQYANAHAKQPIFVNGCLSVGLTRIVYELSALKFMGLVDC